MDIGTLLDTTVPIEFDYMEHKIVCHVFSAGWSRLTQEQREIIEESEKEAGAIEGETQTPEGALTVAALNRIVIRARRQLPVMLSAWDFDGSPMERGGSPWPPTAENITNTPDTVLMAAYSNTYKVWSEGPTLGAESQDGLQPREKSESSQGESSTP